MGVGEASSVSFVREEEEGVRRCKGLIKLRKEEQDTCAWIVCVCICVYMCMYVCVCMCIYVFMYVCMYVYPYKYM